MDKNEVGKNLMDELRSHLNKNILEWVNSNNIYNRNIINTALISVAKEFFMSMIYKMGKNLDKDELEKFLDLSLDDIRDLVIEMINDDTEGENHDR